jgi:peptidylprolyl isomerase
VIHSTRIHNKPKKICLADVIPGFSRGVIGMKKGERRKLYIHPDFAYRQVGWKVPPQTLLIIDVEACGPA